MLDGCGRLPTWTRLQPLSAPSLLPTCCGLSTAPTRCRSLDTATSPVRRTGTSLVGRHRVSCRAVYGTKGAFIGGYVVHLGRSSIWGGRRPDRRAVSGTSPVRVRKGLRLSHERAKQANRRSHPASPCRFMRSPVLSADLREGTSGLIRGTHSRWWWLTLACGCIVERRARYRPRSAAREDSWLLTRARSRSDILPPPESCRCENQHNANLTRQIDAIAPD